MDGFKLVALTYMISIIHSCTYVQQFKGYLILGGILDTRTITDIFNNDQSHLLQKEFK